MRVALGVDHAGFAWKQWIAKQVAELGHAAIDCGAPDDRPSDYPDFARAVGRAITEGRADRAILVCGSGVGAAIAANKIRGIRAGLCHDSYSARQAVEHDDANLLCLGARVIGPALAAELVQTFLAAEFTGEDRHLRRLQKTADIERQQQ